MKQLTRILILLTMVAVPVAALAAAKPYKPSPKNPPPPGTTAPKGHKPWVTDSCTTASFRPQAITFACADNNNFLDNLHWKKWNTIEAIGTGLGENNSCNPDCASGTFKAYRVSVVIWFAKKCVGEPHKVFTRAKLTYLAGRPAGAPARYKLFCPGS